MQSADSSSVRILKFLLHVGFFISGITTVLIGQVLPILADRFGLNDLQVSYIFPAQFSGSLAGTFLTSWFGRQNRFLAASLIGCFLMGAGILMLNFGSFELCLVGFFCNGIGVGLTLPSINMLIFELNPQRATAAVNILNFFWGLGAIICSLTVNSLSKSVGYFSVSAILGAALFVVAGWLFFTPSGIEEKPRVEQTNADNFAVPIWTNPIAWLIAGFNFIHVGFESAMGGWLLTYTERMDDSAFSAWISPIFLFFLFFVVGRGVAPLFLRFLNENQMLFVSLLVVLSGMIVVLIARDVLLLAVGSSVAGLGTSSIFPTNMSRFTHTFGASASRRAMPFFICGTLGATFTTWLIGFTSNFFNSLQAGMGVLLGSIIVLIFVQIFLQLRKTPSLAVK